MSNIFMDIHNLTKKAIDPKKIVPGVIYRPLKHLIDGCPKGYASTRLFLDVQKGKGTFVDVQKAIERANSNKGIIRKVG